MTTKRAARYLRQSVGDDLGIKRQRERTRALVKARGWTDAGTYVDDGESASKPRGEGTAWARLLADAEAGLIDVVVAVDLDRLIRTTRDLNVLIETGVAVTTVDGEIDLTSADGELRASIMASIARFEVRRKGERQKRANEQRAHLGKRSAGVRLYGYRQDGSINQTEAAIVREVFSRFLAGDPLYAIAQDLDRREIRTRTGKSWSLATLRVMLLNIRYAGLMTYQGAPVVVDGQPVRGQWRPLVTEATSDAVRAKLSDPARLTRREGTARKYLLSGLVICGECGANLRSHNRGWRCPDCELSRSREQVTEYVLALVRGRLAKPDLRDLLAVSSDDEVRALSEQIEELRRRLGVVESDYMADLIDGRVYKAKRERIAADLDTATARRASLTGLSAAAAVLEAPDPVAAFDKATMGVQRAVIDVLLEIRLLRAPRGHKILDPQTVPTTWRQS